MTMPPIFHVLLVLLALVLFGLDAYQSPVPTRLTCLGLAALVASMISW